MLKSAILGQKDPAVIAFEARLHQFHVASLVFGIVGAALGVTGLVRRENRVMAVCALAVSVVALLWQYLIIGVIIAVVLVALVGAGI
jgi:hypothetical protein